VQAVREVVDHVQPAVRDHPIHVEAEASIPNVLVDPARFEQILTNLLENAAKYSASGAAIEVSVKGGDREVDIAVRDHGIGISSEELPRLFDRFYQTERARRRQSGLGLGLYIARGFVHAHGGHLSVESTVDHGSTFHVFLPAA
jgi:signal transduction histidine kinase